ncbi:MAG: MFS transporter, partial [Alphaproteobacteria bacterium]|nr:MFS transporter [Alphaproteobacteria bacterium]
MSRDERLSWKTLLAYGGLGLPLAALNLPLYVYLPAFYAGTLGLGLATVGLTLLLARLLDTATDPLIGELSDRLEGRFGRRRPWLVIACPLLIVATFMLFVPKPGVGVAYLLFWSTIAYLAWTMMILPFTAWGAELSANYHERSRIAGVREAIVVVGILLAAGMPVLIGVDTEGAEGPVLKALAWSMSLLLPIALLVQLTFVRESARESVPPLRLLEG